VHHGVGTTHRGIELAIGALKSLEGRFELNLMLVSTKLYLLKLRLLAFINGVSQHVKFHPPVATREIPREISKYDLALVIIEPVTENELDAFPNKFFESIQGRLGVIIGPSPELFPIVERTGIGASMRSWTSSSLVELLETIGPEEVSRFREASAKVALQFSSEEDRSVFFDAVRNSTGK
jgi:glycosyltransferase involved in cell wall biosynthesis